MNEKELSMMRKNLSRMDRQELINLACHLELISESLGQLKNILKGNKRAGADGYRPVLEEVESRRYDGPKTPSLDSLSSIGGDCNGSAMGILR